MDIHLQTLCWVPQHIRNELGVPYRRRRNSFQNFLCGFTCERARRWEVVPLSTDAKAIGP